MTVVSIVLSNPTDDYCLVAHPGGWAINHFASIRDDRMATGKVRNVPYRKFLTLPVADFPYSAFRIPKFTRTPRNCCRLTTGTVYRKFSLFFPFLFLWLHVVLFVFFALSFVQF